jgi:ABC-type branched-subunit amino acid transport system ATPase component
MGQIKKLYEEMTLQELIMVQFNDKLEDEDYQYELWREQQMEQEEAQRIAYEEMLADRY